MSGPLINRSLTTIRTELEFLKDSEVIDDGLYEKLLLAIPTKYQKDMKPWGVDKLSGSNESVIDSTNKLANDFAASSISSPPPPGPPTYESKTLGYCRAIYDYKSQEPGDLEFSKGAKIKVVEHLSQDWWRGDLNGQTGVFPSNYCEPISKEEFETRRSPPAPPAEKSSYGLEKVTSPSPNYGGYQNTYDNQYGPPPPQLIPQPSYGGYSQYPPPSTNYYQPPPPQPQQVIQPVQEQQQGSLGGDHLKKFGSKLGNAAIFGAGATIGSDIVNSIF